MFKNDALNPFVTQKNNVAKQFLKYQVNDTYNCKVKSYPDGTQNLTICKSDIFGRDERHFSLHSVAYKDFKENVNAFWVNGDFQQMQWEHHNIMNQIEVFYKSVDNYLLFMSEGRRFDRQLTQDSIFILNHSLSVDERAFLNSLRNQIRQDNLKKTKDMIFDFVMCNEWTWFFTGTIDPKKYDASNAKSLKPKLQRWFKNMVDRYNISYICIFEYHKKGGIHIHGLIKENPLFPLRLKMSDTKSYYGFKKPMKDKTAIKHGLDVSKGKIVYNLSTWKFGWSTAIRCYGTQQALSHYITKYITKSNQKIMGRYFWHSRDLKRPQITYINTPDYDNLPLSAFHGFKYLYAPADLQQLYQEYTDILSDDISQDKISEDNFMQGWVDL